MAPAAIERLAEEPVADRAARASAFQGSRHCSAASSANGTSSILARAMDVAARSHYVRGVELLLFLSAMLAGLLSGDRTVEARRIEPTAVAFRLAAPAAEAAAEAAVPAAAPVVRLAAASLPSAAEADSAPRGLTQVDERRLE